jgi:hypothetical protein
MLTNVPLLGDLRAFAVIGAPRIGRKPYTVDGPT